MAEMLRAAVALTVDQHEGRRALHPIARHRDRQTARFSRRVDADREGDAIFGEKGLERCRALGFVMLEDAVQTKHDDIVTAEAFMDAGGLRQAMADAAGAQHLERLDDDHPAVQRIERRRRIGVEPLNRLDRGRLSRSEEHTSELQSLMRRSYAVFCLK